MKGIKSILFHISAIKFAQCCTVFEQLLMCKLKLIKCSNSSTVIDPLHSGLLRMRVEAMSAQVAMKR